MGNELGKRANIGSKRLSQSRQLAGSYPLSCFVEKLFFLGDNLSGKGLMSAFSPIRKFMTKGF
jgi:hypothetical protein